MDACYVASSTDQMHDKSVWFFPKGVLHIAFRLLTSITEYVKIPSDCQIYILHRYTFV